MLYYAGGIASLGGQLDKQVLGHLYQKIWMRKLQYYQYLIRVIKLLAVTGFQALPFE